MKYSKLELKWPTSIVSTNCDQEFTHNAYNIKLKKYFYIFVTQ